MKSLFEFESGIFQNSSQNSIEELKNIAKVLRRDVIKSLYLAGSGHSGGSLGTADIFSVLFFGGFMYYDPRNPKMPERDRFVLSAGHICPILYATLARAGYFPVEELKTLRKFGSRLQGHPAIDMELPGIETSAGSLGQGISIAVGMALSAKYLDKFNNRIFALTGDGELQEGSVWETAMTAGNYKLDNLCWIVDNNDCQIDGRVRDVMSIYPLDKKFEAFNFYVISIDGHNYNQIIAAFKKFIENHNNKIGKPTVIIAHTKMGYPISFMTDRYEWHGIPPNREQAEKALAELQ